MIRRMQHLSETFQKEVLESVVKRSAYYAHQENVLIAMINDNNVTIRELGFRGISKKKGKSLKKHQDIHQSYGNLKYQKSILTLKTTPSSFTGKVIINERNLQSQWPFQKKSYLRTLNIKKKLDEKLFDFPCHTQAVQRCIKLVTGASLKDSRDGFIEQQFNLVEKCSDSSQRKT